LPRCAIFSGPPHLASDPYARRGFEIKTAEDSHGVERMNLGRGFRPGKRRGQVETFDTRAEIWGVQANDLGIVGRRLGKQILVGPDQVSKFHSLLVGIAAWPEHMPLKVDRAFVVRCDREDVYGVSVADLEGVELLLAGLAACLREIERQHGS